MSCLLVIGTRPELIKMAPVIFELKRQQIPCCVLNTAQHKDLLDPYWEVFGLKPDHSLDLMVAGQSLAFLTARAFDQFQTFLDTKQIIPTLIMAQGDTTTVMVSSLVAFYNNIPFAHVEAGLRSFDLKNPFPEELNRRICSIVTQFHFAPTKLAADQLKKEGIKSKNIFISGNTVVDSLEYIKSTEAYNKLGYNYPFLNTLSGKPIILITCHRRENHGENLVEITTAIAILAKKNTQLQFVWILHPNPNIVGFMEKHVLKTYPNFHLVQPLEYWDLLKLVSRAEVIITDSGGIQEEAPSFGKPVLVMREVTERPEAISKGLSRLVGTKKKKIIEGFKWAIKNKPKNMKNPYGDGKASYRIVKVIKAFLNSC